VKSTLINEMYWDTASTTSLDKRVLDEMLPYFDFLFGNANSNHIYGKKANNAILESRAKIAKLINANSNEIILTSGSTESINLAIKGYLEANPSKGNHIITVKTEHKAVLSTCEYLEEKGFEVTYLPVDESGLISIELLKSSINENTSLISIMFANNEIGVIQNIKEIGEIAKSNSICFFSDATQAAGKVKIDINELNIDLLCFSAHKMNGPKGIGALFIKKGINITPQIHGGGQEFGLRGGTSNTPSIVGFGKACELANENLDENIIFLNNKRNEIIQYFEKNKFGKENFKNILKVPHIISFTLNDIDADLFLIQQKNNFVASTGSACNSHIIEISHVVKNIFPEGIQSRIIRVSI
jgi:cysteine desulfurase